MKLIFFLLAFGYLANSIAQITTTKVAEKKIEQPTVKYDSTTNFVGDNVQLLLGQDLYLNGKAESLRPYGYRDFSLDYKESTTANMKNIYKANDKFASKYEEMQGKYFTVLDIHKHPKAADNEYLYGKKSYLKLKEKESGDIVYYEYDPKYDFNFPFTFVGYFLKMKQTQIGREFVLRGINWMERDKPMTDMISGLPVDFSVGSNWKCIDVTIEEKYYQLCLVLENRKGEKIPYTIRNVTTTDFGYDAETAATYKSKFGAEKWQTIMEGKVSIGMTKEMCTLSWGEPKKVNETLTSGQVSEQWVYNENYLYFDNGILKTIQ